MILDFGEVKSEKNHLLGMGEMYMLSGFGSQFNSAVEKVPDTFRELHSDANLAFASTASATKRITMQ